MKQKQIEFSLWANEQSFGSSTIIVLGGAIAVAQQIPRWYIGVLAIVIGLFVFLMEYPRGKRPKGNTIPRFYQQYVAMALTKLGPFTSNYYCRFVLYLVLSAPCVVVLPTILGAVSLMMSSCLYFVAAYKGESWTMVYEPVASKVKRIEEPSHPPPRLHITLDMDGNGATNTKTASTDGEQRI